MISEEYTDEVLHTAESYSETHASPVSHTILGDEVDDSHNYTIDLEESNYLQSLANTSITSESKIL